jgi:ferredoxin
MKLYIDGSVCTGHGRCYTLAPELLTYDDEGYVSVRDTDIEVPDEHVDAARIAASACPEQAIRLS